MSVVKSSNADISKVHFKEPKINPKYQNVSVPIGYGETKDSSKPFQLQVKDMKAFVGVSLFDGDGPPKYSLPLSFNGYKEEEVHIHKESIAFFQKFDELVIDTVMKNPNWIKKKKGTSRAVIEAFYTPTLRYPRDKETGEITDRFPPNLKAKLMVSPEGEFRARVFNTKKEVIGPPNESIPKGAQVSAIFECTGLWVVNNKFGVSWRATQLKVESTPQRDAYAFDDSDVDEGDVTSESEDEDDFE